MPRRMTKDESGRFSKVRNALKPPRKYCLTFTLKGGPHGRRTAAWCIRGRVVYFPSYDLAWEVLRLLPWTKYTRRTDGSRIISASVSCGEFRPWQNGRQAPRV